MEQKAGHRYSTAVGKQESPDSSQGRNGSLQRALLPQRIEQSERHIQRQRQTTITEQSTTSFGEGPYPGGDNFVRKAFRLKGAPEESTSTILKSLAPATLKQYNRTYKLWWDFCKKTRTHPFSANSTEVLRFLQDILENYNLGYGSFNSHRSALSLVLAVNLEQCSLIKRFLKGVFKLRPSKPRYDVTWNPQIVLDFFNTEEVVDLQTLSKRLVTLLALITGHRVQTFSVIRTSNIVRHEKGVRIFISDNIKTSGLERSQPVLELPFYQVNPNIA
ncbi:uncharacterized protein LOC116174151 [Photinus pyralis]|uniref:uncharacterized protein LOC116159409 n=1 Tax=Photinus pyralis TaxID=7054 RepID=UPI001267573F|nr:uncharacterized protein LOC116159409 [Photinus pyralis]XP_031329594.1 uncharacterized protein LOC116160522 [Photinus pyralis]XP_031347833.1 uncharacterized protein LOC116174151 [Photinus pyralis]